MAGGDAASAKYLGSVMKLGVMGVGGGGSGMSLGVGGSCSAGSESEMSSSSHESATATSFFSFGEAFLERWRGTGDGFLPVAMDSFETEATRLSCGVVEAIAGSDEG